jgi:general secretion pathway protein F/type IV pilus assembly protein PilC
MMIFVVPRFEALFSQLRARGELPWATDALLAISALFGSWGLVILAVFAIVVLWARAKLRTDSGRWWKDRWKLRLPLAGTIFQNLSVARFCRVLGTLLKNGVPILKSLQISGQATGNRVLASAVADAAENISAGESLAAPLKASRHFPPNVTEMIAVAEESNTLDTVLTDVADSLERHTWRRLDLLVRLVEPVMLLMLAGVVLMIAVALLLPVMKMSAMIK